MARALDSIHASKVMTTQWVLFTIVSVWIVMATLGVVFSHQIIRAAVNLLFGLIGISLLYFLLGAEYLGAAQLIIYVGGTMVLVVFGIMLTSQDGLSQPRPKWLEWAFGLFIAISIFGMIVYASINAIHRPIADQTNSLPGITPLGQSFLGVQDADSQESNHRHYLFPFEIVSVHLLVVLVGAAYLARSKRSRKNTPKVDPDV